MRIFGGVMLTSQVHIQVVQHLKKFVCLQACRMFWQLSGNVNKGVFFLLDILFYSCFSVECVMQTYGRNKTIWIWSFSFILCLCFSIFFSIWLSSIACIFSFYFCFFPSCFFALLIKIVLLNFKIKIAWKISVGNVGLNLDFNNKN